MYNPVYRPKRTPKNAYCSAMLRTDSQGWQYTQRVYDCFTPGYVQLQDAAWIFDLKTKQAVTYMREDFTIHGEYLGTVSGDFVKVADKLKEASYLIRKQGGYGYPIFPMSRVTLSMGALLIEKSEIGNQWYYYATYLDVLIQCELVAKDRVATFCSTYKNPDEFCCLLVVDTSFTNFVYIPYPEE